jgi:hypothetical protein
MVHCVVSRGRRALERWDLDGPYDVVTKGCHTCVPSVDACMTCWSGLSPCRIIY